MPPRAIKHELTCPFELTSGSFLIGRRRILVIPRNHTTPTVLQTAKGRIAVLAEITCNHIFTKKINYANACGPGGHFLERVTGV